MSKQFLLISALFISLTACVSTEKGAVEVQSYTQFVATPSWYNSSDYDTVRVLSWNVEHFVDEFDNPYINNGRENNPPENMEERKQLLAQALVKADADIVVFQEFESPIFAQKLAEDYFPELGYQVSAAHTSNDWYMNVVVMSRIPLGMFYSYGTSETAIIGEVNEDGSPATQAFTNNRMWTVDVLVNKDYHFALTGVHLKAGRGERNENWRIGQMQLIRSHLEGMLVMNPNKNILAVGDFNSTPESREIDFFLGKDTKLEFIDPLAGTNIFSHPADSAFWRIDHIFPSKNILPEVTRESVQVHYYFSKNTMRTIADHLPMTINIVAKDL